MKVSEKNNKVEKIYYKDKEMDDVMVLVEENEEDQVNDVLGIVDKI